MNPGAGSGGSGDTGSGTGTSGSRTGGSSDSRMVRATGGNSVALAIEKLKGRENYVSWAFAMKMTLIREGSWCAVMPKEGEVVDEDVQMRALSTICLSLEKTNYSLVMDAKSAQEAWNKLKTVFQDDGIYRRIGLLQQLTSIRLENYESTEAYVDALVSTSHKLAEINFPVADEWLASLLLMGLPKYYAPMVMGLEASGQALKADAVKAKILQDVKPKHGPRSSNDEGAFYSGGEQHQRRREGGGSSKQKDKSCYNCHKVGHYAANCPEKPGASKTRKGRAMCAVLAVGNVDQDEWYFDSGATTHMARPGSNFQEKQEVSYQVGTANKSSMTAKVKGVVNLDCLEGPADLQDVLEVPELAANLLSVSKICSKGFTMVFTADGCKVLTESGEVFASGTAEGGLYRLNRQVQKAYVCGDLNMWHRRFGHLNLQNLKQLQQMANGFSMKNAEALDCVACLQGKHARDVFPNSNSRAKERLELVHTDLCGPFEVPSLGGSRFFVSFIDDATRKVFIYTLETKGQAMEAYENFKAMAERQSGCKLKILRSDNGREYVNGRFKASLQREGIRHQKSCPYTPEQNGVAERMNRTILEKVRCMLNDANLPKKFWAEAVNTAVYLINRSPTRSSRRSLDGKTPEEAWTGEKPFVGHSKIFGSVAMMHVPKQKRKKLDPKSTKCVFVGYAEDTKGYRLYNPENNDIVISRDVRIIDEGRSDAVTSERARVEFLEIEFSDETIDVPHDDSPDEEQHEDEATGRPPNPEQHQNPEQPEVEDDAAAATVESTANDSSSSESEFEDADQEFALPPQLDRLADIQHELRRSGRERQPSGKYKDFITYSACTGQNVSQQSMTSSPRGSEVSDVEQMSDPTTYNEALSRPDRELWMAAMREEITALETNETWVLEDLPEGGKAIKNKWVFKTKRGPDGKIERYKARLVVKGCSQRPGVDYDEVYSPVVRYSTIRFLMALATKYDLEVDQMDAVTAFLQGKLNDEVIHMQQPEGFANDRTKVCRLQRALYGLKQSSRVWNQQLDAALREFGLEQSKVDPCLYYKIDGGRMIFVTIYVDDFLIFSSNAKLKKRLKKFLCSRFQMKDLGQAKFCLGLRITRDRERGELSLDQQSYIEDVIGRFHMTNCHPVATPFEASERLDKSMSPQNAEEAEQMKSVPYKEAVGCLQYIAQATRPDICYAVNAVSQYSSNPGRKHWEAVKRIFRYLKGTVGSRLRYSKQGNGEILGYTDADWGGDVDTRRSTTGYVFMFQGGAISWNVKKQPTVALSSCEAEYMALSRTIQEALWWRNLLKQIFDEKTIQILCDNQSAICIAKNGSYNPRTKHVDIRYHFVHEAIENGTVLVNYVNTKDQAADGFTKPLVQAGIVNQKRSLGITD